MNGIKLRGTGRCVPANTVTNDDLSRLVDTNDEWITARTGIRSRKPTIFCLTGRKGSVPALWVIRCLRARMGVFPPYQEGSCIPRPWRRAFRCIPAG